MRNTEKNNIILNELYGGVKGKSTPTTKAMTYLKHDKATDENKVSILISSDLSSAFNTVPAEILSQKLKFYGICGRENNPHWQNKFTQIENKRSRT